VIPPIAIFSPHRTLHHSTPLQQHRHTMSASFNLPDTSPSPVILVTGSSRLHSLGLTLIHACSLRHPTCTYILTYRTSSGAQPALDHLRSLGVTSRICLLQLDVDSDESILRARDFVEQEFGSLDGVTSPQNTLSLLC
jgi:hypothetical protein